MDPGAATISDHVAAVLVASICVGITAGTASATAVAILGTPVGIPSRSGDGMHLRGRLWSVWQGMRGGGWGGGDAGRMTHDAFSVRRLQI